MQSESEDGVARDLDRDIAIVGIGCRFPGGANDPRAFWDLLEKGFNAITEAPANRPGFKDLFDPDPKKPGRSYSRWGGFLDRVDLFDAQFFGVSPREAVHIDPQHRLLLELVWEACEDAGIPPPSLAASRTGVFVGISSHDYGDQMLYPQNRASITMHTNSGGAGSIAANRISYLYDFRGPSVTIDTACSSALSAAHFACQSLRSGECTTAFVGGVQMLLSPEVTVGFCKATMLSPDGQCRAFDASANGYVRGEGAGVVMLKPLRAALDAGDPIYAVIRATAINQDGHTVGMTVPSAVAQQAMIEDALLKAGIGPRDVQYVEAHGTGTPIGDPIEARAIGSALSLGRDENQFCAIGSVKTNLGHTEAAAGVAGLIKVALSLQHRQIPASLHFRQANSAIDLNGYRLRVVTALEPWPAPDRPAIAGVNSFGFGGANAHAILQAAPEEPRDETAEAAIPRLLTISAKTPEGLKELASAYAERLRNAGAEEIRLRDLCYTASERRAHHDCRLAVVAASREDFAAYLTEFGSGVTNANVSSGRVARTGAPKLAFVFSGMGPQWWGMGKQLLATEPVFRRAMEQCDAALRPQSGWSLLDKFAADEANSRVASPELAHLTNFAIQFSLLDLWASWGITPDAVVGHSGGAMAAAYAAGIYDLEDAIRLAFHRSRLTGRPACAGRMLAVGAPFDEIETLLTGVEELVSLSAVNGPASITLTGDGDALERIRLRLEERQIFARLLPVTIAYHSPLMDKIKDEFLTSMAGLRGRKARIPFLSDLTGTWASGEECDAQYWWRAIRQPVLFRNCIDELLGADITTFVEVGPHPVLASSIQECMKERGAKGLVVPSIRRREDECAVMKRSLGGLYAVGCKVNWAAFREDGARVATLPLYPWQRERHWLESSAKSSEWSANVERKEGDHPLLGTRLRSARPLWEGFIGTGNTEYLQEHVVQGSPVYPGAAYVEMALASRMPVGEDSGILVRDVEFLKPLLLRRDGPTPIQFTLDPEEGRFEVFSSAGDSASWICHSRGIVMPVRGGRPARVNIDLARERISTSVPPEEFYARMEERSIHYGPKFRRIQSLWSANRESLAFITTEGLEDFSGYSAHPALLDACFHALAAAVDSDSETAFAGRLLLPAQIGEFRFYSPLGNRFWATCKITEVRESGVSVDLQIIDEDGNICLEVRDFRARMVDPTEHGISDSIDQWIYDFRWEPMALDAVASSSMAQVSGHLPAGADLDEFRSHADALSAKTGWYLYYEKVQRRLNELAAAYIAEAAFSREATTGEGWRPLLAKQCLEILERFGPPRADAATLAAELLRDFPAHQLDIDILRRCGPRLADVVAGRAGGRDVLFTGEGYALLQQFYREGPAAAYYNALMGDLVADFASTFDGVRPMRVLEVGAGTGGTTAHVLPRLNPRNTSFVYSDVSNVFLDRASAQFSREYPFLSTRLFDVTRSSAEQGLEAGSFDLIFATNVVHATPAVKPCVERLRDLLAPGGALVLLEITNHPYWFDIIFGLMDGWWVFEDRDRRPNHPLMTGRQWQSLLEECGFESPTVAADSAPGEPAQAFIFGRRGVEQTSRAAKRWLLLADEGGVGKRLASVLAEHGIESTLVRGGADLSEWYEDARSGNFEGIIHLRSLDTQHLDETPTDESEKFASAQSLGCTSVLSILQRVIQNSPLAERGLILVTAGAQWPASLEEPALLQTPLWGLGRVIRKEWPRLRCRLIDLSAGCSDEEIAALGQEILSDNGEGDVFEEEIALRNRDRFVRRMRRMSLEQVEDAAPAIEAQPEDKWHAEMPNGSIDSIVLKRSQDRAPAAHEVEIAIRAASLNFRDVVMAMGVVPGLTADNTQLGSDVAGTITRCGDAVKHLRPGDEVFGIANGSFGSVALAPAVAVAKKPARITAEQASTLPTAFLTAYYAIHNLARLSKGESILIHVASGGVGHAAIQIARACGARIFATAGSPAKRSYLESLGITDVMDSRSLAFADEIAERTGGRGVDVVLNSLAGEALERGIAALAPYGRFVELGKADIYRNSRLHLLPFKRNLTFFALDLAQMLVERPEVIEKLSADLAPEFASGKFTPIPYTEFPMTEVAGAMRFMAQAKHIGKVVVTNKAPVEVRATLPEKPPVRADATYLITGGLGGAGLLTARWLAERGARSLVLVGRSSPSLEAEGRLAELRSSGARVEVLAADVSREEDIVRVLDFIRANLPPLRGVLHAAMVLSDTPLADLDESGMARVMAPKVLGAWYLHKHTMGESLDFFFSFSSVVALLGNQKQANYAAANAFLDALAVYRRARHLPATTIDFGVLAGSGWVARQQEEFMEHLNRQGYLSFTEEQTLEVISEMLRHDAVQLMATRMDWKLAGESNPRAAASPRLRHLIPTAERGTVQAGTGSVKALLGEADPSARPALVEQYVREQVARLLGALPSAIEPDRPITEFGLDSLIAAELTGVMERDLDVQIAGTKLLSGISVHALAQEVYELLGFDAVPQSRVSVEPAAEQPEPVQETAKPIPISTPVREAVKPIPTPMPVKAEIEGAFLVPSKNGAHNGTQDYANWTTGQKAIRGFFTAGFKILGRIETEGLENIPATGPCVLAVNHLSMAEAPLYMTLLKRRSIPLVNRRLQKNRVLNWFVSDMGQAIYLTRDQLNEESLQRALAVLNAGGMLAIAPEGTRSRTGGLLQGKPGIAWLATQIDVPVVPLVAWGQEKWRQRGKRLGRIPIHVRAGAPLRFPQGLPSPGTLHRYTDQIMAQLAALLPPEYRGVYAKQAEHSDDLELAAEGSRR
ncbi:MAG: SDR family NAD(P)-dependent oxidoreductase [Terracidiphilus sp.]